jgi:hypothetical protein
MPITFDPQTLSITVDMPLDEYAKSSGADFQAGNVGILGLSLADIPVGDRSRFLEFRHEHAHFTSFITTGLSDLQGVISDYLLVMLHQVIRIQSMESGTVEVPIIAEPNGPADKDSRLSRAYRAWSQVNGLRAMLFGFGTRTPLLELLDRSVQESFWDDYYDDRFRPIVHRYYELLQLLGAHDPQVFTTPYGDPRPLVPVSEDRSRPLTVRSVMEAYAVAVELMATHVVAMKTDQTFYGSPIVRHPIPMYMTAIEYVLHRLVPDVALDEFLSFSLRKHDPSAMPLGACYLMLALTYAAMQVPVLQLQTGHVLMSGSLGSLSVSHRLCGIVESIVKGDLELPPEDPKNVPDRNARLLDWLRACHRAVGDADGMQIYEYVRLQASADEAFQARTLGEQSVIDLSWAGRANFIEEPVEYVYDAGLFAERYTLQPRFIRTSDGKIVMPSTAENRTVRYFSDRAVTAFEAAVFGSQWEYVWGKLAEVPPDKRCSTLEGIYVYTQFTFGQIASEIDAPAFTLRSI